MYEACCEERNATRLPSSIGSPRRPRGIVVARGASRSWSARSACGLTPAPGLMREVRNMPGSTRLIVMPSLARSGMIAFISPAMPGRIPFDRSMPSTGRFTELDWIPTIRPHRFARMCGTTARTKRTKFSVITSNARRQSSSAKSANLPSAGPPELLTRTSTPPKCPAVSATTLLMPSEVVRSAGTASTSAPVSRRISPAAACRSASVRAQIVTRAPSRASASAHALPRPLLDAATSATLPFSPRSTRPGRLADAGERPRLAAVAAGLQPDDQPVADRDDVIGPVVGLPPPELVDPRRPHHQHHPVTGRDDLLEVGPQPAVGLAAQRLLQLPAAMADLRLRVFQLRVAVGPVDLRVHEVHHPRDIAAVVGQEGLTDDPLILVAHL